MHTYAVHYKEDDCINEKVVYVNADNDGQAKQVFDNRYNWDEILLITQLY